MSTPMWIALAFAAASLLAIGFWCLNQFLRAPPTLPFDLDARNASRYDAISWVCAAITFTSCSTCVIYESSVRKDAYRACVEAHSVDDCREARP